MENKWNDGINSLPVLPPYAFQMNKPRRMLSSAQHKVNRLALLNATYFPEDKSKVSQGRTSIAEKPCVHFSTRCSEYCILRLCSGTSVPTCWWPLTDGCSLSFYMAVRSHIQYLFPIVAGWKGSHGKSPPRVQYKAGMFLALLTGTYGDQILSVVLLQKPKHDKSNDWWNLSRLRSRAIFARSAFGAGPTPILLLTAEKSASVPGSWFKRVVLSLWMSWVCFMHHEQ